MRTFRAPMHAGCARAVQSPHAFADHEDEETGDLVVGRPPFWRPFSLALPLTGCTTVHTAAPAAARTQAATGAPATFGTVDCRQAKCIALTFDAGPSENSAKLLDILKEKQVPATFFLLGKRHSEKYPELVKRMAAEGHEVASHTWDHRILTEIRAG